MEKRERAAKLHASALRRELDRCLSSANASPGASPAHRQRAEMLGGRAQLAMTRRLWPDAISLFEDALRKLTDHPASLSPPASVADGLDDDGERGEERWFRVGIPALLRAGPSLSSLALERLEAGAVVKALQAAVEFEGRMRLQVAGYTPPPPIFSLFAVVLHKSETGECGQARGRPWLVLSLRPERRADPPRGSALRRPGRRVVEDRARTEFPFLSLLHNLLKNIYK